MYLPLGKFSPSVKIGLVSASRNCFPRKLSEERTKRLLAECKTQKLSLFTPSGDSKIIESKTHALDAAEQMKQAGCDAAVLYLGNFSPEIEDANFVKNFNGPVMLIAAEEESKDILASDRGDALCGLLSAMMAIRKRGLEKNVHVPEKPLVSAQSGALAIAEFVKIVKVVKGIRNATLGLFGPRPRDFETCNYNIASVASLGVEIEELALFDLENAITKAKETNLSAIVKSFQKEIACVPEGDFVQRLAAYEKAILGYRDQLKLSGAATQCWAEQEFCLKHVPCSINARLASRGFPVACENDVYSLISELMGQYATDASVTVLDLNHSIPADLNVKIKNLPNEDLVGLFHCGNTDPSRLKNPEMKYQLIMKRLMEPKTDPDITRGTVEGMIAASPITVLNVYGQGDDLVAYLIEGEFLDLDPKTFGSVGTAYLPGFGRFYRHVLLGNFHHHAAVAFGHCGATLFDAMKMLGVKTVYTPQAAGHPYPGENLFRKTGK